MLLKLSVNGCLACSMYSIIIEPVHEKPNKMMCAPSDDSDQPGHPPSLIRVFTVNSMGSLGPKVSSCGPLLAIRILGSSLFITVLAPNCEHDNIACLQLHDSKVSRKNISLSNRS